MKALYTKQEKMLMITQNSRFYIDVNKAVEIAVGPDFVTIKQLLERARIQEDAKSDTVVPR